jgi:hypothetical protein
MLHLAMILYIVTACISFFIAYDFYRTKDGELRRALIAMFAGVGIALMTRGIWGLLELAERVYLNPFISLFAIGIVFFSYVRFAYVIRSMRKNRKI